MKLFQNKFKYYQLYTNNSWPFQFTTRKLGTTFILMIRFEICLRISPTLSFRWIYKNKSFTITSDKSDLTIILKLPNGIGTNISVIEFHTIYNWMVYGYESFANKMAKDWSIKNMFRGGCNRGIVLGNFQGLPRCSKTFSRTIYINIRWGFFLLNNFFDAGEYTLYINDHWALSLLNTIWNYILNFEDFIGN